MDIVKLNQDYNIHSFDCGDEDLNDFLLNEAKDYQEKNLAITYLAIEDGAIVGYFSILNDRVSKSDATKAAWRKMKKNFPHTKHRDSYPSIKIGRFAVALSHHSRGFGSELMLIAKHLILTNCGNSAFRFLTVDAYINAIPFYQKNGFVELLSEKENDHTRTMYFDINSIED